MLPVPVCHGSFAVNGIIALWIICPPVRAPAFFSGKGAFQHGTTQKRKCAGQLADFLNARFQCLRTPHDTECVQQNTIHLHLSIRGKIGQKGFFGTGHIGGAGCFLTGSFRSDLPSIDRTQKGISTQTVCAVVLSAAFTGSVQIPHRSAVPLVHLNAAHKVMDASARKAPTENFITTFARYYTPVVVGMAAVLAIIPPLVLGGGWSEWLRRGFVFLIVSCPCALVISIPLTFFGGIGAASKRGVLVKGSNYLEALNKVSVVVFDKTGTLTKGVFEVANIIPAAGYQKEQVLEYAAQAESYSNHPIAKSILATYGKPIDQKQFSDFEEISGHGISVMVQGKKVLAGNSKLMESEKIAYAACDAAGTKFYVAADGSYVGCILIADEVKPDSNRAIAELKKIGVEKTVMLTGDDERIGKSVADELGLDAYYAQLLPDQKVEKLEMLDKQKRQGSKLAFVGDGINDAPVLARADVGIAMGGLGSDAAIEAADVVLMTDEPSKLVEAIDVAKATKRIVMQNIVIALGIKSVFLVLGALGMAGMWEAVFGDVGVTIIAVLNAMRILKK